MSSQVLIIFDTLNSEDEKMQYFLKNVEDCSFKVGMEGKEEPRKFKSFKFVLCSVSPVFERMFNGAFKEAHGSEPVVITDIFACDFEVFLDLVHCAQPNITRWKNVYDVAKKYMAEEIAKEIFYKLSEVYKKPVEALQLYEITYIEKKAVDIYKYGKGFRPLLYEAVNNGCNYIKSMSSETIQLLLKELDTNQLQKNGAFFQTLASLEGKLSTKEIEKIVNTYDFSRMPFEDYFAQVDCSNVIGAEMKNKILGAMCRYKLQNKLIL